MTEDAIFEWNMTMDEAEAYKIACIYQREYQKYVKNSDGQGFRRNKIPDRGDPRKSNLFRHCWKMRRETRGLVEPHQYRLYVIGNIVIVLKNEGRVEPHIICGDKAWRRWKLYERWFREKEADRAALPPPPSVSGIEPKIIIEIDATKKFLFQSCEGEFTEEKMKKFIDDGFFKYWIMTGKVSKYYLVLSPLVAKLCDVNDLGKQCSFDPLLFKQKISKGIEEYFNYEYQHEQ